MPYTYLSAILALAPPLVAAVPWGGPEPTIAVYQDPAVFGSSPAPTSPPQVDDGLVGLLKRQADSERTCGAYVSGYSSWYRTCSPGYVCATNDYWQVAGCCDPSSMARCSLMTSCVPAVSMKYCTGAACLSDSQIIKCSSAGAPYCYNMLYDFGTTTVTEFGCTSELHAVFTVDPYYTSQGITIKPVYHTIPITVSVTTTPSPVPAPGPANPVTTTPSSTPTPTPKTNVGAIAGGIVGGLSVVGALIFGVVFLILRNRRKKPDTASAAAAGHGMPTVHDYKPPPPRSQQQQQQYPVPEQHPLMQPGNTASFYQPAALPPKHEYANVQAQPVGHARPPETELPSPSLSPAPQYTPPVPSQGSRPSGYPPPQQYQRVPVPDHVAEVGGVPRPYHPHVGGQAHELA